MSLTPKQEKYVQGLFKGLSQRQAYKQAFDANKMKDDTIDKRAHYLAKEEKIKGRLRELQDEVASENIATEIEIQEFWTEVMRAKDLTELKDKLKASELLGKNKKMFTEKIEHSGEIQMPVVNIVKPKQKGDDDE